MNMARIVGSNDTVRTIAFADNGKTTTLVELTKRNPNYYIRSSIIKLCDDLLKILDFFSSSVNLSKLGRKVRRDFC